MMKLKSLALSGLIMISSSLYSITKDALLTLTQEQHPFAYNLGLKIIPSKQKDTHVTICCHGYGHNNQIVDVVHSFRVFSEHLIGFNFPDHNIRPHMDHSKVTFGTIDEILPLLYIIKRCVVDLQISTLNLYGFSAGGGAVVNVLATLNHSRHDERLVAIGITPEIKTKIIHALENGTIILDCPLKSVEEVLAFRGTSAGFETMAFNYANNNMRPIDALDALRGLQLNILLHFQNPDEILSNRDDALFSERLHAANSGITKTVIGTDGGHVSPHPSLWAAYKRHFIS